MKIETHTFFSVLASDIRLRCLHLLMQQGELCVCELTYALELSQPMISRHLALLRSSGLVIDRRSGKWVYYQVNPDLAEWAYTVLHVSLDTNTGQEPYKADVKRLRAMPDRPDAGCCR